MIGADATSIIHIYVVQTVERRHHSRRQHLTGKPRHAPLASSDIGIGTIIVLELWEIAELCIFSAMVFLAKSLRTIHFEE